MDNHLLKQELDKLAKRVGRLEQIILPKQQLTEETLTSLEKFWAKETKKAGWK